MKLPIQFVPRSDVGNTSGLKTTLQWIWEEIAKFVNLLADRIEVIETGTGGYWTILTNGDPVTPEIIFDSNGDVITFFVPGV